MPFQITNGGTCTGHINKETQVEGVIRHQFYCVSEVLVYILTSFQSAKLKMQLSLPPPPAPLPPKAVKQGYNDLSKANQPATKYPNMDEININKMHFFDVAGYHEYQPPT